MSDYKHAPEEEVRLAVGAILSLAIPDEDEAYQVRRILDGQADALTIEQREYTIGLLKGAVDVIRMYQPLPF